MEDGGGAAEDGGEDAAFFDGVVGGFGELFEVVEGAGGAAEVLELAGDGGELAVGLEPGLHGARVCPGGQLIEGRARAGGYGGEVGVELQERGQQVPLREVWVWARGDHDGGRIRDLVGVSRGVVWNLDGIGVSSWRRVG